MNKDITTKDPYAIYRHLTFQYLQYYLCDFFDTHSVKKQDVKNDCGFGGSTLPRLLKGKDMHFNCYVRLLFTMRGYCKDDNEHMDLIVEFMKRAMIEIWLIWGEEPQSWMLETWKKMQEEKDKYITKNN